MALREILIDGQPILVEVADLEVEGQTAATRGGGRFQYTDATDKIGDMKDRLDHLVQVLATPVQNALKGAGADEWTVEISIGFKGETGLPFIASGEANAALKVSAKWKKA
jgi:hypothetical protein